VEEIRSRASAVAGELEAIGRTAPEGRLLRQGALVVLAGSPNAGKSTLFNALAGEERALVTELPGTTRDAIELDVSMGGYPFRLVDTAGLRDTDERLERMGIEVAERYLKAADLVLFCLESGRALAGPERRFVSEAKAPGVLVRTKVDAESGKSRAGAEGSAAGWPEVRVSARTGAGLDQLRSLLPSLVFRGLVGRGEGSPVLTRERQARAVAGAEREVRAFADALGAGVPAEVASAHLKTAMSELEALVGVWTPDEVLDRVFRSFCIGK
jgi:tRNA modification GTPase